MTRKVVLGTLFLLVIAAGAGLRLPMITEQIAVVDEIHAPLAAVHHGYGWIATHFFQNDVCIPLALLYKVAVDHGGLTELAMRLPQLGFGIGLLLLLGFAARRVLRPHENLFFLALLAVSPQLIFYSRYARPYIIATFFAMTALIGLAAFFARPRYRSASVYVTSAVLAAWFHLLALPFVLAGPAYAALTLWRRPPPSGSPKIRTVILLAVLVLVGAGSLHLPAWLNSSEALTSKIVPARFSWETFSGTGQLFAGVTCGWAGALALAVAACGMIVFARRNPWLGGCLLFSMLAQIAAVLTLSPSFSEKSLVFARYVLWVLPALLFFLAVGATAPFRGWWKVGPGATVLLAILWFSPLPDIYRTPNNFTNHPYFQADFIRGEKWFDRSKKIWSQAPPFHRTLAREPGDFLILETPLSLASSEGPLASLQRYHRKRVAIGVLDPGDWLPLGDRLRFRNTLPAADGEALRRRGVKYLVLHKRPPEAGPDPKLAALDPVFRREFREPIFEDRWVRVYRVR